MTEGKLSAGKKNGWFFVFALFVTFIFLECVFTFIPKTHNVAINLSHRVWEYYYGKPVNNWGFRDDNVDPEQIRNKKVMVVLGDSFTYGNGIKDYRKRYTDLLEQKLAGAYKVINMGKGGNDTLIELQNLTQVPVRTDVVIHQYFGNDIEFAGYLSGKKRFNSRRFGPGMHELNKYSFLVNFITTHIPQKNDDYNGYVQKFYLEPGILERHLKDIHNVIQYTKSRGAVYIGLIFPLMADLEYSRIYTDPLVKFYESEHVPYINVADLVKDMDVRERIIHKLDAHAGLAVQKLVAGALYEKLKELGYAD